MNPEELHHFLRTFRRQVFLARLIRYGILFATIAVAIWVSVTSGAAQQTAVLAFFTILASLWLHTFVSVARLNRELQIGVTLSETGQPDNAEVWLKRAANRFCMVTQRKLQALLELAVVLFRRKQYEDTASMCGELLRQPISDAKTVAIHARLMQADSLLRLSDIEHAYAAMRPVFDLPLGLGDRTRLLPIQLRYELAADHPSSAVQGLTEKIQIAELLDSPQAALVHALLAEACRRQSMTPEQTFLYQRATLYHDLATLTEDYPQLSELITIPIADSIGDARDE